MKILKSLFHISVFLVAACAFVNRAYASDTISALQTYAESAKSIVFILEAKASSSGRIVYPSGTGFLVGLVPLCKDGVRSKVVYKFLITNEHVLREAGLGSAFSLPKRDLTFRINAIDAKHAVCRTIPLCYSGPRQNVFSSPSGADLVAVSFPDIAGVEPLIYDYSMILPASKYQDYDVNIGTEIFTAGLLTNYAGSQKNSPLFRFGRIAMMPDEPWYQPKGRNIERGFIAEFNTSYGSSGSPVFLVPEQIKVVPGKGIQYRKLEPVIVGIIKGKHLTQEDIATDTGDTVSGVKTNAPIGLAIVEYSSSLTELLDQIVNEIEKSGVQISK